MNRAISWLRAHDAGFGALRRATRAAIVMPLLLAFGDKVVANPSMTYFIAFGSFAMLLLVGFSGSMLDRLRDQALLGVGCAVLICLGSLAGQSTVTGSLGMAVVGFVVLFSGVVSSVLASATTALLLAFILPVTLGGPVSEIPDRVAGWGLAVVVSLFAIALLWPAPSADPIRERVTAACKALAARLRAEVAWVRGGPEAEYHDAVATADASVADLEQLFFATPYRPTGLSTEARAEIRLVDQVRWLGVAVLRGARRRRPANPDPAVIAVKLAAAELLESSAALVGGSADTTSSLIERFRQARESLRTALGDLEERATSSSQELLGAAAADQLGRRVISALDPSFRAQEIGYVTRQIAENLEVASAAARRPWLDRVVGREPRRLTATIISAGRRARAHAAPTSSWLHNSIRGAVALGLAVLAADLTSVQHGFWVVFGTLAVLRSSALSTGESVVRALVGTAVGFAIGGVLVAIVGTDSTVLWAILPVCVLFAGLAPAAVSFAAGQAAFTLTLLVLFNLLVPVGWRIGIVRVEDVALGGVVSLAVGILFWPRGAGPALGRALAAAYRDGAEYLASAVAYGVGCCDAGAPMADPASPRAAAVRAVASAIRLDDTFRGFLADRGPKRVPMAEVATLVSGITGVRLAGDAVLDLWREHGASGDRAAARQQLLAAVSDLSGWYERFAVSLSGYGPVPGPLGPNECSDGRLAAAVSTDLRDGDGRATATGVRVIWTGDHLDAVRRLQETLVGPAHAALDGV